MNDKRKESAAAPTTKAMILAAGLGTRLKPFTDKHPKALAQVNGKSLLQRNIEYLQQHRIYDVIINTHHFAEQIEKEVEEKNGWGSRIILSYEKDVLETGGGLLYAQQHLPAAAPFVLMNVDILTNMPLGQMIAQHQRRQPLATLAVSHRTTSRYFLFSEENELCGWRNVNSGEVKIARPGNEHYEEKAFSGIHIISPRLLQLTTPSFSGKFSIVDVYLKLAATESIQSFQHNDSVFIDVGKPESLTIAETLFS